MSAVRERIPPYIQCVHSNYIGAYFLTNRGSTPKHFTHTYTYWKWHLHTEVVVVVSCHAWITHIKLKILFCKETEEQMTKFKTNHIFSSSNSVIMCKPLKEMEYLTITSYHFLLLIILTIKVRKFLEVIATLLYVRRLWRKGSLSK